MTGLNHRKSGYYQPHSSLTEWIWAAFNTCSQNATYNVTHFHILLYTTKMLHRTIIARSYINSHTNKKINTFSELIQIVSCRYVTNYYNIAK